MTRGPLVAAIAGTTVILVLIVIVLGIGRGPSPTASASPDASVVASPSPSPLPSASAAGSASATPVVSATPSVSTTPTPVATATPTPTATPSASPTTKPTATPTAPADDAQFVAIRGSAFSDKDLSGGGKVVPADGSVILKSTTGTGQSTITYEIAPEDMPIGIDFDRLDVRVCGVVTGEAWEIDGPSGSTPDSRMTEPPENDGCWHFDDGNAESSALLVAVSGKTQIRIDRVIYRLVVE